MIRVVVKVVYFDKWLSYVIQTAFMIHIFILWKKKKKLFSHHKMQILVNVHISFIFNMKNIDIRICLAEMIFCTKL